MRNTGGVTVTRSSSITKQVALSRLYLFALDQIRYCCLLSILHLLFSCNVGFYCSDHLVSLLKRAALMFRENMIKLLVFLMVKLEVGFYWAVLLLFALKE